MRKIGGLSPTIQFLPRQRLTVERRTKTRPEMIALAVLGFFGGLACLFFSTPLAESFGGNMVLPVTLLFFAIGLGTSVVCAKSKSPDTKARVLGITFSVLNGLMLGTSLVVFLFYAFGLK